MISSSNLFHKSHSRVLDVSVSSVEVLAESAEPAHSSYALWIFSLFIISFSNGAHCSNGVSFSISSVQFQTSSRVSCSVLTSHSTASSDSST